MVMHVGERRPDRAVPRAGAGLRVRPQSRCRWTLYAWAAAGWTGAVLTGAVQEAIRGNPVGFLAVVALGAVLPDGLVRRVPLLTVPRRFGYLVGAALVVIAVLAAADPATDLVPRWRYVAMAGGLVPVRVLGELADRARRLADRLPLTSVYWHSQFGVPGPLALPLAPLRTIPGAKLVHHGPVCLAVCGRRVAVVGAHGWARRLPRRAAVRRFDTTAPVGAIAAWLRPAAGTVDRRVLAAAVGTVPGAVPGTDPSRATSPR